MKQILLVDDDFLSLNAFYALTDWSRYGLHIAYEAHNGNEALSYLLQCGAPPAVAFIDVCMPDMDGIALLQTLRAQYPDIVCVMLSSYSDYPYVRKALKLGAADYLLKHEISPESILQLLAQHKLCSTKACSSQEVSSLSSVLAGNFLSNMRGYLLYATYQGDRPLIDAQLHHILQTCRHILNPYPSAQACTPNASEIVLFLPLSDERESSKSAAAAAQYAVLVQKALLKYHNARYAFKPPHFCADCAQLQSTYRLYVRERSPAPAASSPLTSRASAILTLAVLNGQNTLIEQALHTLFENASAPSSLRILCNSLLTLLSHIRRTHGLPDEKNTAIPLSREQAETDFVRAFQLLSKQNSAHLSQRYSPGIYDALEYVNRHYAEDIHLSDIASHCHLSYAHLSHLFKKETGDNLISYINHIRVYHAAYLILFASYSVQDACQNSGFKGYNHFVTTFKAITGMTPSEFRKNPASIDWLLKFLPLGLTDSAPGV